MDRFIFFHLILWIELVWGHGRLIEPPMRSSMWRYGFKTPKNYNDNELNCGGFAKMMESGGRCGPCGDPWFSPKNNEAGGIYATGTIARYYATGQIINVTVELTSNHNGYFEFRICPNNDPTKPVTQECLNRNVLNIMGYGKRYNIETKDSNLFMEFQLALPPGLSCSQCVLQWKWRAAQNRGSDGKGGECFGCGPQEHFINCADVAIGRRVNALPLNRPGQRGVYMSKTGPQTKVIHTPSPTAAIPKPTVKMAYDASVMEPPTGAYSNMVQSNTYNNNNNNNYQNEIYVDNVHTAVTNDGYQNVQRPRAQSHTAPQQTSQVPTMSKQVSYDAMLDSKNAITSMVLQYMASLPMDVAAESAMTECSEGYIRPICKAIPMWNNNRPFDEWCSVLCPTGVCPAAICSCTCPSTRGGHHQNNINYDRMPIIKCKSMTAWGDASMDQWCTTTCNNNPDNCPSDHCYCDGL